MATTAAHVPKSSTLAQRAARKLRPFWFLVGPIGVLVALFVTPLIILVVMSFQHSSIYGAQAGFTLDNFRMLFTDPIYRTVAKDTIFMATTAMLIQLAIALPLAYFIAFRAGRWELPMLLLLVLVDELNPIVRIYAWRMLLGREGVINDFLVWIGLVDKPLDWLLFTKFSVILVLSTSWVNYTALPIYASMKAINPLLFEAATDLGAGWYTRWRRVLIPLAAPGIFVAVILVYIPLFTDFATPGLVGGTSSYMLGNSVADLMVTTGDWGGGAALSLLLLGAMAVIAVIAYFLSKLNQLD
jgi:ABC-type spermidine/putrescine transport system permease subunit I